MDGDGGGFSIFVRRLSGTSLIFVWYYLYIENIFFLSRVSMNISKRGRLRRIIVLVGKRE